jgi:hypothetical protein
VFSLKVGVFRLTLDRKSLTTMSNAKGVVGRQTLSVDVDKTLSPITTLTRFPKRMLSFGLSGPWPQLILVADG